MRELDVIDVARQVSMIGYVTHGYSCSTGGYEDEDERMDRILRGHQTSEKSSQRH